LGEKLGISETTVYNWEKGRVIPKKQTLDSIYPSVGEKVLSIGKYHE
jgi:DNA-binding XRE family transcriptional regulator